jgi:gliding motility-associated protein GldM
MSIPKEPRQLMINLMYLVLTAMLALNVSAKIMNAFFLVDDGIQVSNKIVNDSNNKVQSQVDKQADAYAKFKPLSESAKVIRDISTEFTAHVDELYKNIISDNGRIPEEERMDEHNHPRQKKNKDITTRILVNGDDGKEPQGDVLEKKIVETKKRMLDELRKLISNKELFITEEEITILEKEMPLGVSDEWTHHEGYKSWGEYNFNHMPVAAVMPMLTKFSNDSKTSETAVLNYLMNKAGATDIKFDEFQPVLAAKKAYVISGEKYEAEVFLSAYSKSASGTTRITVNGSSVPMKDGKGQYSVATSKTGTFPVDVKISVTNPVTNETKSYNNKFEYEVGRRSCTVSADKMNVFYIGVDNPVSVSAAGVSTNNLKVTGKGINITQVSPGKFNVTASVPDPNASITVSSSDGALPPTSFAYRVKRIPDPKAYLGRLDGGSMKSGEFRAQGGVLAQLENFDFDARCIIQGYEVTRVAKRQDPVSVPNAGASYVSQALQLVNAATPGDIFYFDNVKAKCPGDVAGRKINSMVFKIQ